MNTFEYKGYLGSAEVDTESRVLVGKLLFIRDLITYSATDVGGLEVAFKEAVEDYLATCKELGDTPDIPCKGSFNVRPGPDLHKRMAMKALAEGKTLNEAVCESFDMYTTTRSLSAGLVVTHKHEVTIVAQPSSPAKFNTWVAASSGHEHQATH